MTRSLPPTSRLGQGVAAALAVLLLAVVWLAVAMPLRSWFDSRAERLGQRRAFLERMEGVAATLPALRTAATDQDIAAPPGLLSGMSDAVAAAALQQDLQRIAAASGLGIATVDTTEPVARGEWHLVGLRVGLKASWPALVDFMRGTQALPAGVFIDELHIHGDVGPSPDSAPPLQVSMLVYGFRQAMPSAGR